MQAQQPEADAPAPAETPSPPPEPRHRWREPHCAIDWPRSSPSPGLLRALAAAQALIHTVGKDAENTHHRYKYAPADAVVEEMRRAFAACGVALLMSWRCYDPPFQLDEDSSQWIDWHVVCDWALVHGGGPLGEEVLPAEVGMIVGTAACVALGDRGRGPDKSMLTARTTIHGALALSLAQIDRGAVDPNEDASGRQDDVGSGGRRGRSEQSRRTVLSAVMRDRLDQGLLQLLQARRVAGHRVDGKPITATRVLAELTGAIGDGFEVRTDADAERVLDRIEAEMALLERGAGG